MAYILPQVKVFQELLQVPGAAESPLSAHISGGHAFLLLYRPETKHRNRLGFYNHLVDTSYAWPEKPAASIVDVATVRLHIEDALLEYFRDAVSAGSMITVTPGYRNRIRSDSVNFRANGDAYPRSPLLYDRDVRIGDVARVRAVVGAQQHELWTYVRDIKGDPVPEIVHPASDDPHNAATQSPPPAPTFSQTGGPTNCVEIAAVDQSLYDGLRDGDINETYTVLVTQSSVNGDATTARLQVISASGRDDQANVVPAAFGLPTSIGTRGLKVTFALDYGAACSEPAEEEDISPNDFIAGQRWTVTAHQNFTAPQATSGGSYSGERDTTYVITVTRGGKYADGPQITVTTTTGYDYSGPTTVSAANTAVPVGSFGTTVKFDQSGLRKGDRYYIPVVARREGPMRTLVLGHNLPAAVPPGTEVDLTLYIRRSFGIPGPRQGFAPQRNWSGTQQELTVFTGLTVTDPTWTNHGVPMPLEVVAEPSQNYGILYVQYRAWLSELCRTIGEVRTMQDLEDRVSGELHPLNPLKWALFKALQNSNGVPIKFTGVCDPDSLDSWMEALSRLDGVEGAYGLVPLTFRHDVISAYLGHALAQSSPEKNNFRVVWAALQDVRQRTLVDEHHSLDGEMVLATISDDPLVSGSQYVVLQVPARNAGFITNGVRPGDRVRILYTTDGFGNEFYSEYVVERVINEDELRLVSGPPSPVSVPERMEIWRTLNKRERAEMIARQGGWADRRLRAVWPDVVGSNGMRFAGYHLAAALAALASAVRPHQGLTNISINGFDDLSRTVKLFSREHLDIMAEGGVWVVTQDPTTGQVYTRHALTSGSYDDLHQREEMITRNLDAISFSLYRILAPFIGRANVAPSTLRSIRGLLRNALDRMTRVGRDTRIGPQVLGFRILNVAPHPVLRDHVIIDIRLRLPVAMNVIELHLVV